MKRLETMIIICRLMIETIGMWQKDVILTFGSKKKKINEKYKYLLRQSISDINDLLDEI